HWFCAPALDALCRAHRARAGLRTGQSLHHRPDLALRQHRGTRPRARNLPLAELPRPRHHADAGGRHFLALRFAQRLLRRRRPFAPRAGVECAAAKTGEMKRGSYIVGLCALLLSGCSLVPFYREPPRPGRTTLASPLIILP